MILYISFFHFFFLNFNIVTKCLKLGTFHRISLCKGSYHFPGGLEGKASACNQETWVQSLGREDHLEKEMATHSSILVWERLWTKEPGGLQSMGLQKSRTQLKRLNKQHVHTEMKNLGLRAHYLPSISQGVNIICPAFNRS